MPKKFIEDEMNRQNKKNYAELLAQLNPKPSAEVLEKLLNRYIEERNAHENKYSS
jgi:hypothetical protein